SSDAGGAPSGSASTSASEGSSSTGGTSHIEPTLTGHALYMDCTSQGPHDPILGSFDVRYENRNPAESAFLDLQFAKLRLFNGDRGLALSIGVDPSATGLLLPSEVRDITHVKIPGAIKNNDPPDVAPCSLCGGTWWIELGYADGESTPPAYSLRESLG